MAKLFQTVVRRVIQVASGNGFIASVVKFGIRCSNQIRLIGAQNLVGVALLTTIAALFVVRPGIGVAMLGAAGVISVAKAVGIRLTNRIGLTIAQNPAARVVLAPIAAYGTAFNAGIRTALLGVVGVAGLTNIRPAVALAAVIREHLTPQVPAFNIVQIKYDLIQRKGAATGTEANGPCGRQDFDTPANATGVHNGTVCTCAGNTLGARCGRLNLAFAETLGKTALTIQGVRLHFYYAQTSLLSASSSGGYNFGGADTQLFTHAALTSPDFLTTPNTFDITSAVGGDWSKIDSLRAYVIADIAALALNDNVRVDAVEVEITATATQTV